MSVPVSESAIQTKVAGAVFAGEQHQTRDCRGEPTLDQTEQASAQASTLHVRCDHQSADVDCMRIIRRLGHPDTRTAATSREVSVRIPIAVTPGLDSSSATSADDCVNGGKRTSPCACASVT